MRKIKEAGHKLKHTKLDEAVTMIEISPKACKMTHPNWSIPFSNTCCSSDLWGRERYSYKHQKETYCGI